jgi:hypothetical protein
VFTRNCQVHLYHQGGGRTLPGGHATPQGTGLNGASSGHAVAASRSPSALTSRFPEREETSRFIRDPCTLAIWSPDFFQEIAEEIETV